jgi:hypothetical protein
MQSKKIKFLLEQVVLLVFTNFLLLFYEGLLFSSALQPYLLFALVFLHLGTISCLYVTMRSTSMPPEKEQVLFQLNLFFYIAFVSLLLFQKCSQESAYLGAYYGIGLFLLSTAFFFLLGAGRSYKKLQLLRLSSNSK